jgi:ABC-2 type transport system permease protein
MNTFKALVQREWLQHRFGWAMVSVAPLVVAMFIVTVGQSDFKGELEAEMGTAMPAVVTMICLAISAAVTTAVLWATSLILTTGLARRDHGDRSHEFWLSMPIGHGASLGVPLLVHLIAVPVVAVGIGLFSGIVASLVLVSRAYGVGEWLALPWDVMAPAAAATALRVAAGIPLATLWLLPLILLAALATAHFRIWGLVVLPVALALADFGVQRIAGFTPITHFIDRLFHNAGVALFSPDPAHVSVEHADDLMLALSHAPAWALTSFGRAVQALWSPTMLIALLISAASFALLVHWRSRSA